MDQDSAGPFPGPSSPPAGGGHPVLSCAARVDSALKGVRDVQPTFMTRQQKGEALIALSRARDQLEALRMRVIAACGDVAEEVGSRHVATWLAAQTRADRGALASAERLAGDLDGRWLQVAAGLTAGEVNLDQARVIVGALNNIVDGDVAREPELRSADLRPGTELLGRAEARLVELAAFHDPAELRRLGDKILEMVAPDLYEEEGRKKLEAAERRAAAQTRLSLRNRGDGTVDLRGRLPESAASRLRTYLDSYTSPRHQAMARTGCEGGCEGGARPAVEVIDPATGRRLPQDRVLGEALCAFLEHADPDRMPLAGGSATKVIVTTRLSDLVAGTGVATLGDGTRIGIGQARRLACTAGIIPAVLGSDSEVLDLGRESRLYDGKQRQALAVGHPVCRAEHCTVSATWCEAHHKKRWSAGGRTDLRDGILLCPCHHHRVHDPVHRHEFLASGDVRFHKRR